MIEEENNMNHTVRLWVSPASSSGKFAAFRTKCSRAFRLFHLQPLFRFLCTSTMKSIMSRQERCKMLMYKSVQALLQAHSEELKRVPILQVLKSQLLEYIVQMEMVEKRCARPPEIDGGDRIRTEERAFDLLIPVCFALYSFARKTGNEKLKAKTLLDERHLRSLPRRDLLTKAIAIAEEAFAHEEELLPYGIFKASVLEMQECVKKHTTTTRSPDSAGFAAFLRARRTLLLLFEQADELLDEDMDRVIEIFRQSETMFYNQYFSVRDAHETIGRNRKQPFLVPSKLQPV